jgi:hypothetical protein
MRLMKFHKISLLQRVLMAEEKFVVSLNPNIISLLFLVADT